LYYFSHRRGGLARLLYDAVRAEARQNKELVETQLDVYAQNVNSLAFHASIGFRNFATVLRRPVSLAREAASGFSFRVAGEEDRVLLDKAVAWRSDGDDKRARQMREMWNKNSWVARNEHGIAVACFHWRYLFQRENICIVSWVWFVWSCFRYFICFIRSFSVSKVFV
jgi:hypothetical protein